MPFCDQPFYRVEINTDGDVYTCCPSFLNISLGNIYKTPFDEIWNGDIAKNLRKNILSGENLHMCSDLCYKKELSLNTVPSYNNEIINFYPLEIAISTDKTCNVKCIICRDSDTKIENQSENFDETINNILLPIFKDAKLVHFGIDGDPFSSKKECKLIKALAQKYPDIKYNLQSNGIIANEQFLKNLNVFNRIETMTVSIHAASWLTYNKIVKGGNWKRLLSNLSVYSNMKKQNIINNFKLIFCVFSENYKEMPKFVKLAQKYNAEAIFWTLRKNPKTNVGRNFSKYSVINPFHKKYNDLKRILKNPVFDSANVILHPDLKSLREKSLAE